LQFGTTIYLFPIFFTCEQNNYFNGNVSQSLLLLEGQFPCFIKLRLLQYDVGPTNQTQKDGKQMINYTRKRGSSPDKQSCVMLNAPCPHHHGTSLGMRNDDKLVVFLSKVVGQQAGTSVSRSCIIFNLWRLISTFGLSPLILTHPLKHLLHVHK
jgi:hypothetical protein